MRSYEQAEEDIIRKGRALLVDTTDPRLNAALEERARTGRFEGELMFIRKDGTRFHGEVSSSIFTDRNGQKRTSMIIRDVTERRKAKQELADEMTKRKILISQSRDGIVTLDRNGKVYEANQRFADMPGYTSDEMRELHVWDWDTQIERVQLLEMIRTIDEAGDHFETRHYRKDGTGIDVEISTNAAVFS